jgi:hypothetical protein
MKNNHFKKKANPLLIFIYPWKFTESQYKFLEITKIKKKVDIEIWDLSEIIAIKFANKIMASRSKSKSIIKFDSYFSFFCKLFHFFFLKKRLFVINQVPSNYFVINCLLLIFSKYKKVDILNLFNSGVPLINSYSHKSILQKIITIFKSSVTFDSTIILLLRSLKSQIVNKFFYPATKILVSGSDWRFYVKNNFKKIQIIEGHSHDYSNFLMKNNNVPVKKSHIVFLDCAAPLFTSDSFYFKKKEYLTIENWYPSLCNFFDFLEQKYNMKVVIAGHYKSKHSNISSYFGNRHVYYGRTYELIRDSLFVINVNSTAISYAISLNKPLISIVSNELLKDEENTSSIFSVTKMLGTSVFNIDDSISAFNLNLFVDKRLYSKYKYRCLTSVGISKSNSDIIISKFIGIK